MNVKITRFNREKKKEGMERSDFRKIAVTEWKGVSIRGAVEFRT